MIAILWSQSSVLPIIVYRAVPFSALVAHALNLILYARREDGIAGTN